MKKLFLLFALLGVAVVVFHSCKKKFSHPETISNEITNENNDALWNRIIDFKVKVNASDRDSEFITPDSALWYLEALFNVEQAVDTNYNNLDLDTTFYTLIPNENGLVDIADVAQVYNIMVADLELQILEKNNDHAFLIISDLSNNSSTREGSFIIQTINAIGINPIICYDPIYSYDDWYYGHLLGRLDGQYIWISDAGQELQKRFNNPINCFFQGGGYWVSVEQKDAGWSEYPTYLYNEISFTPPWISDTEMGYYLSKGHSEIIYKLEVDGGKMPLDKNFKVMEVWTNEVNPDQNQYFHSYKLFYGVQIGNPE